MAGNFDTSDNTIVRNKPMLKPPSMYAVVVMNDDYTPMEFVVLVLCKTFKIGTDEATQLMLKVHREGRCKVGSYTFDVAETKAANVVDLARQHQYPLLAFVEKT